MFQQFLSLSSIQQDMSCPILGDLSNIRWLGGNFSQRFAPQVRLERATSQAERHKKFRKVFSMDNIRYKNMELLILLSDNMCRNIFSILFTLHTVAFPERRELPERQEWGRLWEPVSFPNASCHWRRSSCSRSRRRWWRPRLSTGPWARTAGTRVTTAATTAATRAASSTGSSTHSAYPTRTNTVSYRQPGLLSTPLNFAQSSKFLGNKYILY